MAASDNDTLHRTNSWPETEVRTAHHIICREDTSQDYAFANAGAPYPISEEELHILQSTKFNHRHRAWRALPPSISLKEAHRRLETYAHKSPTQRQQEARQRLLQAYDLPRERMTQDLFIKIFNDLDILLFHGLLQKRVRVRWDNFTNEQLGLPLDNKGPVGAYTLGPQWLKQHVERTEIVLNAVRGLQAYNREIVWGGLIHEMLHAYLHITAAGFILESHIPRYFPGDEVHGPMFQRSCNVLVWRLAFPEMTPGDVTGFGNERLAIVLPVGWEASTGMLCYQDEWPRLMESVRTQTSDRGYKVVEGKRRYSM